MKTIKDKRCSLDTSINTAFLAGCCLTIASFLVVFGAGFAAGRVF